MESAFFPIPNFNEIYISHAGVIESRRNNTIKKIKIIRGKKNIVVRLYNNGATRTYKIDWLVATTFLPNPMNFQYVGHIDGDEMNCNLNNLEWWPDVHSKTGCLKWIHMQEWPNYEISSIGIRNRISKVLLKPTLNRDDYPHITLYNGKNRKIANLKLHRLMAEHFVENSDSQKKTIVNHKDGDKTNYHPDNLEWVTQSQNCIHAIETGLRDVEPLPDNTDYDDCTEKWLSVDIGDAKILDTYEISDQGRVRNIISGKILRGKTQRTTGYREIKLAGTDGPRYFLIHRLVAGSFIGCVKGKEVNHLNKDRSCNKKENLQIIESNLHKHIDQGRTLITVCIDSGIIRKFESLTLAAKHYNYSIPTIAKAISDQKPRQNTLFFDFNDPIIEDIVKILEH